MVVLTEEDLHYLLALEPGERMVTAWAEPHLNSVVIGIEGDETTDLKEVTEGCEAPQIERPFAMAKLHDTLRGMVARHYQGELSDDALKAIGNAMVRHVFPDLLADAAPAPDVP